MTTLLICLALGCRGGHAEVVPPARGGAARPASNVEIGHSMAKDAGWSDSQWNCLYALWERESGWQTPDTNPSSGAAGVPQALPPSKMGEGWQDDVAQQIRWGIRYVIGRYGSACNALAHSSAYGFY